MTRYCKSCGPASKTQSPLFITFIAAFFERSVFLAFYIAQTYSYTDRHTRSLYPATCMVSLVRKATYAIEEAVHPRGECRVMISRRRGLLQGVQ